ncbi:ABC transporter permease [Vacuolonema iberomarrocanum]|uniref:ABC transporter permease n=1 Tax=Vacuolonema iberomarrocanum TaxID=3454632 RepID=UPI0019EF8E72|nr:ABC transporter permease subunit [filamentous cyanobacterium LEGE 07170]
MTRDPVERIGQLFAILSALICLIPLPLLLAVATTPVWQQGPWSGGFTLKWLRMGWETVSPHVGFSLRLALVVLFLNIVIGFPTAWVLARTQFFGRQVLMSLTMLPLAIPGIAIALGLILAYPTWKAGGWLLLGGHVLYTLPFWIGTLTPALSQVQLQELEAVGTTLGASRWQSLVCITLPQIRSALLAAAIIVLTLSLGEFNVSFFLFTPIDKTLPVELYAAYITGRLEVAAASTVWFLLFVIPAAISIESLGGAKVGQAS